MRLEMLGAASLTDWLHFLHLLAAMLWFGSVVALSALATHTVRSGEPTAVARFVASVRVIGPIVFAPGPLVLIAAGIWLVADSDAWGFGQTWVWLGLALFAAAFVIGAAFQSRAAIGAHRSASAGDDREAARLLGRWVWGSWLIIAILLAATWDMVFKPGF
jgi:uncharacterized membrane protein